MKLRLKRVQSMFEINKKKTFCFDYRVYEGINEKLEYIIIM
jgi:hypothetical protein